LHRRTDVLNRQLQRRCTDDLSIRLLRQRQPATFDAGNHRARILSLQLSDIFVGERERVTISSRLINIRRGIKATVIRKLPVPV
jgi:hypothetical protein